MIEGISVVVTPFMQNARVVFSAGSTDAVVVDPGGDVHKILGVLTQHGLKCREIWLTHSHLDHCGGVADLKEASGARLVAHRAEELMRQKVVEISVMYGLFDSYFKNCPEPDLYIDEGDELRIGEHQISVMFTPGHSPGHVSFYAPDQQLIISGDVLFAGGIGRVDLPGGDYATLMSTIRDRFLTLADDTRVWCGHGDDTTIGAERRANPFLR